MNYLEGNVNNMVRIGYKTLSQDKRFTQKIKPLRKIPEKEIGLYVLESGFEVHFDGINIVEVTKKLEIAKTNKDLSNKLAEIRKKMTGKYAYAYTTYLDAEKSTKTSLTLNSIKATGHGRKCILMCWGAIKVTTLTARLSVYVNGKDSCSGITSSTSYVPVFDSNIITLPEGENTIEIRLSAQANTATAYIGRYHKLGFIVAEL